MSGGDGTTGFPQPETVFSDIKTTIPFRTGQWNAIVEFRLILVCPKKLLVIKTYSTLVRPVDVNLISHEFNDMHQQPHDQEKSLFDRKTVYRKKRVGLAKTCLLMVGERLIGYKRGKLIRSTTR